MEQQLEFILRDMLDDLKALRASNAELQNNSINIINSLNTFEKLLKEQKQNAPVIDTSSFENVVNKEFIQLKNFITAESLNKRIEHKHHLHKGLFVFLILMLLCFILSFGWYKSYNESKSFKANDIKYRALQVVANKSLRKLLSHTDSLYSLNNDSFELKIIFAEKDMKRKK